FDKIYGSIGTVLIIMLIIRFNALILLIGFELNVCIMFLASEKEAIIEKIDDESVVATQDLETTRLI
ncbi:MAG: hypothetical protein H7101_12730, partial [Deinococcales bacterium]|nr:hypothetical protein [Chitinophagaceae bacterium]